jgi:multisubunit Na+/H+ antiporter MnhC subunit
MHDNVTFFISAFLALIAIFVGLYLPAKENTLNEWIGTGFLLGGAFVLIFGTIQGYGSLHRWLKPVIMLAELLLVIFLAYKKVKNLK